MKNQKHKMFPIIADTSFQGSKTDLKQALPMYSQISTKLLPWVNGAECGHSVKA